jgi:hypothetical protein
MKEKDPNLLKITVEKDKFEYYETYPPGALESIAPSVRNKINTTFDYAKKLKEVLSEKSKTKIH